MGGKLRAFGKIDLHLHLDGSLSERWVREQLQERGEPFREEMLRVPSSCRSLNEYLRCFALPLGLLQRAEELEAVTEELILRLSGLGLVYAEIRFAPQQHTARGLSQEDAVAAVLRGRERAQRWRTMRTPITQVQFLLCCMRRDDSQRENLETVDTAGAFLGKGVAGLDLAGAEALYPTGLFREVFRRAAAGNIPFTIHAGEAAGPESVRCALEFGAARIGHGVRAGEAPELVAELARRRIPLEMCPSSNLQTGACQSLEEYPLRRYLEAGVPVTLNSDNMTVSGTDVGREFALLEKNGVIGETEARLLLEHAVEAAFLPEKEKETLRARCGLAQP